MEFRSTNARRALCCAWTVPAALALVLAAAAPAWGQGDPNQPQRDNVLSQVDDAFSMPGFEERFNPYSGHVTLRVPVIDLPGKGGLDLVLPAYYTTETYNRTESALLATHVASIDIVDHLGGGGWQLHFGKVFNPAGGASPNNVLVVLPDGSTRTLYTSTEHPGELISEDRWRFRLNTTTSRWELTDTRGTIYEFDDRPGFEQVFSLRGEVVAQCVAVRDVFGNSMTASYSNGDIQTITDSFGRTVQFNYLAPLTNNHRLSNVQVKNGSTVLQQFTFAYSASPLVTWTHPSGSRAIYGLTSIDPPASNAWTMTYKPSSATFAQNRFALSTLTLPTGGTITYTYSGQLFNPGCQSHRVQRSTVATRATGGRDVVAGTWSYAYSNPGDDGMTTTVTGPSGSGYTEVYVSEGYGGFIVIDENLWSVGRLRSKTVSDSLQDVEEAYAWEEGDILSGDTRYISNWVGCGSLRQDGQIKFVKPVTVTRTVSRGTTNWETTQSLFDVYGNPTRIDDDGNVSRTTTLGYFYSTALNILEGRVQSRVQAPGTRECFTYNSDGSVKQRRVNPTTCVATDGITTNYLYDGDGQLTEENTENIGNSSAPNRRRQLQLYSFGIPELEVLPVTVTAMSDVRINRNITALGLVEWEEDGRQGVNFRTQYLYDGLKRVTSIDPPVGLTTTITYAADGSLATVSRGSGADLRSFTTSFDGFGRKRTWTDVQRDDEETTSYDNLGRKTQTQLSAGGTPADVHIFDDLERLTLIDHPDTFSIDYSYSGNSVTVTDEDNDSTILNYEAFGDPSDRRLKTVVDAESRTWTYGYHSSYGLLSSVTSPSGSQSDRSFTYTTRQFLDLETHPETGQIDHGYSNAGDRVSTSKGGGVLVAYKYDGPGRLWTVDAPMGTADVEFIYDQASNPTRIENVDARYVQTFDGAKRQTQRVATLGGGAYTSGYSWDGHDRLQTVTYPSGRTVTYTYDAEGRVDGVDTSAGSSYVTSITYRAHGGVDVITYGNGAFSDFDYDTRLRPTFIHTQERDLDLDYDPASRIDVWSTNGIARTFTYDDLGRIDSATGPRGEVLDFLHNAVGNRTSLVINGVTETYTYSSSTQRLSSVTGGYTASYLYDAQGRLTSSPAGTFTWTALDRLATVSSGSTNASYAYDGEGRRVKATVNGAVRWFVLDPWGKILAEYDGAEALLIEHIYLGEKRIASRLPDAAGTRAYVQHDPLGSSWIVTSGTGSPYQIWDYWPFGRPVGIFDDLSGSEEPELSVCPDPSEPAGDHVFCDNFESGNSAAWTCTTGVDSACNAPPGALFESLFTGKKLDAETGLFYFEARHLDPRIGRLTSPDQGPLVFENPQTFNRYAYATNNPLKYDDPDGKLFDTILDVGFIAYDLFDIGRSAVRGEPISSAQWGALGADVVGAALPFVTGGGLAVRLAAHGDDIADGAKALGYVDDAAQGAATAARGSRNPIVARAAAYGQEVHKTFDYGTGFRREFLLPSGRRADAVNLQTRTVKELKPNRPGAIAAGRKQLEAYRRELEAEYPGKWTAELLTYEAP